MQKVVSFITNLRSVGSIGTTSVDLERSLEKSLNDGYTVKTFTQSLFILENRNMALMTFILEKSE